MQKKWLSLSDIPAEGREFSFQDDQAWEFLWEKNKLPCTMDESLTVWVNIIPQKKGFYIQGKITGAVFLPCNRCLEQARVVIDNSFGLFEEFEPADPDYIQKSLLRFAEGRWELDLQHLFWEQFVLALPDKYLCSENCKGLCPHCGQNLNEKSCSCEQNAGDPRLAVLKQFKIKGKS
ncbi:YceD family protein [Desulfovulcanus sp.]